MDTQEIALTASLMVREFNDDAANQALRQMNERLARGDWEGEQSWRWVLQAIDRIQMEAAARQNA